MSTQSSEAARERINVDDHYDIAHWTARFMVSEQQLREAVGKVGPDAHAVEYALKVAGRSAPPAHRQQ